MLKRKIENETKKKFFVSLSLQTLSGSRDVGYVMNCGTPILNTLPTSFLDPKLGSRVTFSYCRPCSNSSFHLDFVPL